VAGVHNKNLKLKRVVHKEGITVKTVWLFCPGFPTHYPKKNFPWSFSIITQSIKAQKKLSNHGR